METPLTSSSEALESNDHQQAGSMPLSKTTTRVIAAAAVIDPAQPVGAQQRRRRLVVEPLGVWVKDGRLASSPQVMGLAAEPSRASAGSIPTASITSGTQYTSSTLKSLVSAADATASEIGQHYVNEAQHRGHESTLPQHPSNRPSFGPVRTLDSTSAGAALSGAAACRFQPYNALRRATAVNVLTAAPVVDRQLPATLHAADPVFPPNPLSPSTHTALSPSVITISPDPTLARPHRLSHTSVPALLPAPVAAPTSPFLSSHAPHPQRLFLHPSQPGNGSSDNTSLLGPPDAASTLWQMWVRGGDHEAAQPAAERWPGRSSAPADLLVMYDNTYDNNITGNDNTRGSNMGGNAQGGRSTFSSFSISDTATCPMLDASGAPQQQCSLRLTSRPLSPWTASCAEVWQAAFGEPAPTAAAASQPLPGPASASSPLSYFPQPYPTLSPAQRRLTHPQLLPQQLASHAAVPPTSSAAPPPRTRSQHLSPPPEAWAAAVLPPGMPSVPSAAVGTTSTGSAQQSLGAMALPRLTASQAQPLAYSSTPHLGRMEEWH